MLILARHTIKYRQLYLIMRPAFNYSFKQLRMPSATSLYKIKKIVFDSKRFLAQNGKTKLLYEILTRPLFSFEINNRKKIN